MLVKAFDARATKNLAPLICTLTSMEKLDFETAKIYRHGCLILEELLNFKKPIQIVNSILELPDSHLVKLLCDPKGSYVTDAFIKSTYVGEKSRTKLFKKLQVSFFNY